VLSCRVIVGTLAALLLACVPSATAGEWQFKPFIGATYGGNTTFILLPQATNRAHFVFGGNGTFLGEIFGLEGDFGHTSGFFREGEPFITDSGVTTVTGNVIVAMPRRLAQYTLRPYLVGGAGLMHIRLDLNRVQTDSSNLKTMDLGAGVTGFLTKHVGVSWDVRYFRSIDRTIENGLSFDSEHLSFWRASMAMAIRL
jgi:hypothetical protein